MPSYIGRKRFCVATALGGAIPAVERRISLVSRVTLPLSSCPRRDFLTSDLAGFAGKNSDVEFTVHQFPNKHPIAIGVYCALPPFLLHRVHLCV